MRAVSVGFGGEVRVWARSGTPGSASGSGGGGGGAGGRTNGDAAGEEWKEDGEMSLKEGRKTGDLWAPALSHEGRYLVGTTIDGKANVWDLESGGEGERKERKKIMTLETKGSFGICCDMVRFERFGVTFGSMGGIAG